MSDNTRSSHSDAYLLAQKFQRQMSTVGNAAEQELCEKLICTYDEEDDLSVPAPARKQLQSILAYFLSAYLSQRIDTYSFSRYPAQDIPVKGCSQTQLCVFRI